MYQILTREAFALNRKYARRARQEFQVTPEELEALAGGTTPDAGDWELTSVDSLQERIGDRMADGLKALTENERAVLLLRAVGYFRYREISDTLDIPIGSVMGHLSRARRKLRAVIGRERAQAKTNRIP
jgi:DNA-directed RNA polymerase specialized sigma24 family protein